MVNLGDRRDGRFASAARDSLLNRHAGRQSAHQIHIRFFKLFDELPRIRRHAVEKAPLSFGKQDVERECRFSRSAQTGDDHQLLPRNLNVDILEVVLTSTVNVDGTGSIHPKTGGFLSSSR